MSAAIEIEGLRKTYPRSWRNPPFEALKGISLHLSEGEVFGFIGPNGAGKSTTIKILTGVMRPTAGAARLFDTDVSNPAARRGLGYVPENPSLPDYLTPIEVLRLGVSLHRLSLPDVDAHCMSWLDRFGMAGAARKLIRGFSKGMAQRTVLAHAMAVKPRLLILDEPLSGLDPVGRRDVVNILDEYRRAGGTIFFTSHVLHDVERLADRLGFIHQGELITTRSPRDLVSERADQLIVRYQAGAAFTPLGQMIREGEYEHEISQADLPGFIAALNDSASRVLTVKPAVSLETVFFKILESGTAGLARAGQDSRQGDG
jgi:ABC-2 type transport system ATP-binding protein